MAETNIKSSDTLEQAIKLYHQGRFDESENIFSKLSESGNDKDKGHYGLGVIKLQEGKLDEAIKHFTDCVHENPTHADALFYLGQISLKRNDVHNAFINFNKALEINPDHKSAQRQYHALVLYTLDQAKKLYQLGQFDESAKAFTEIINSGKFEAAGHYGIGVINFQKGMLKEAQHDFEQCVKLHPRHANAYYYLGRIAEKLKDTVRSRDYYQTALKINPNHAGALRELNKLDQPNLNAAQKAMIPPQDEGLPGQKKGV